jgi:hypothetical protein
MLRYYPRIHLEGLRKITKKLIHDSQSLGQDMNPGPPKYYAGVLIIQLQHLVKNVQLPNVKAGDTHM